MKGVCRGVADCFVQTRAAVAEVPDAGVVRPWVPFRDKGVRVALGGAVEHRELGAVRHLWERDPYKRIGVCPRVDLEWNRLAVRRGEPDVAAAGKENVVVVETRDAGLRDPHKDGEVRERRSASIFVDREYDTVSEAVGLDRVQVDRGNRRERGSGEEREKEFFHSRRHPFLQVCQNCTKKNDPSQHRAVYQEAPEAKLGPTRLL